MLARFLPLGAELQGDVEVLGPRLDQRWVAVGLLGPGFLEHRAGEAVEVAEGRRGRGIDVGERLPGLLAPALADEPRRARPAPGSRRRPARRTASRTRRACSGGRSRSPASAPARPPPPRPCGGQHGSRRSSPAAARAASTRRASAPRTTVRAAARARRSRPRSDRRGGGRARPACGLRHLPRADRIVGEGKLGDRRGEGSSTRAS